MIDQAIAELERAISEHPGQLLILGYSMYEGDIRDVIKEMVFDD